MTPELQEQLTDMSQLAHAICDHVSMAARNLGILEDCHALDHDLSLAGANDRLMRINLCAENLIIAIRELSQGEVQ